MSAIETEYHKLLKLLNSDTDFFVSDKTKEKVFELISNLYQEHCELEKKLGNGGKYGISYTTRHEDSKWKDTSHIFFTVKEKRDEVFASWNRGEYWDSVLKRELQYPTPQPNCDDLKRIFRDGDVIYAELTND